MLALPVETVVASVSYTRTSTIVIEPSWPLPSSAAVVNADRRMHIFPQRNVGRLLLFRELQRCTVLERTSFVMPYCLLAKVMYMLTKVYVIVALEPQLRAK